MSEKQSPSKAAFISTTHGIRVAVEPTFCEENSKIDVSVYVYTYTITITNESRETVQLLSRHWIIQDGFNRIEHVKGEGVVGQKPRLGPGESFTYTSYCPLPTPSGTMRGTFQMKDSLNKSFDVNIDEFHFKHASLVN